MKHVPSVYFNWSARESEREDSVTVAIVCAATGACIVRSVTVLHNDQDNNLEEQCAAIAEEEGLSWGDCVWGEVSNVDVAI